MGYITTSVIRVKDGDTQIGTKLPPDWKKFDCIPLVSPIAAYRNFIKNYCQ